MTRRDAFGASSPFVLIIVGRSVEQIAGGTLGVWAWVPTMVVFWGVIAAVVRYVSGSGAPARWFRRPTPSAWCWLSVAVGLLSFPELVGHWRVLLRPDVFLLWLLFALVNPLFEEAYWRGCLLDATRRWPPAVSVPYSAILFAVSHPLIWGVQSAALREWRVVPVLAVIGAIWTMAYRRTGSLACSVVGHALANLFGMSVPLLLNLYSPFSR